jgi:YesN/AraC family two-component response regulator
MTTLEKLEELTILYVEDEKVIRTLISDSLELYVKEIIIKDNGYQGFKEYCKRKDEIDIIITDIHMPKKNGLSMIRDIKKINKKVKVIVTSAYTDPKYLLECIDLKIDKYLTKPINFDELIESIGEINEDN